jgi:hypothetical protein
MHMQHCGPDNSMDLLFFPRKTSQENSQALPAFAEGTKCKPINVDYNA